MVLFLCIFALIALVYSQSPVEICSEQNSAQWPKRAPPPQRVLIAQLGPGYTNDVILTANTLRSWATTNYPGSIVDYLYIGPGTATLTLEQLSVYTQIWTMCISATEVMAARQLATYDNIVLWYRSFGLPVGPELIVDARIITAPLIYPSSPLWPLDHRSYFHNFAVRGGGLVIGSDSISTMDPGNYILKKLGVAGACCYVAGPSQFQVDPASPFIAPPFTGNGNWFSHNSAGNTPIGFQAGIGRSLYPVTFNSVNNPGISSTIRGAWGFQARITSPACGAVFTTTDTVTFTATTSDLHPSPLGGVAKDIKWSLLRGGAVLGTTASFSRQLPVGQHIIVLDITSTRGGLADRAFITITVLDTALVSESLGQCLVVSRNNNEAVTRIHSIDSAQNGGKTANQFYEYVGTNSNSVIAKNGLGGPNFYVYRNPDGMLYISHVMPSVSKNSRFAFTMQSSGLAEYSQSMVLLDDPADSGTTSWDNLKKTGRAAWDYVGQTEGFILGPFARDLIPLSDNDGFLPWCLSFNFTNTQRNTPMVTVWGASGTSVVPAVTYKMNSDLTSLSICRASCFCPAAPHTKITNKIWPVQVRLGNNGQLFGNYNDILPCTWTIRPATKQTGAIKIGITWDQWAVNAGDTVTVKSASKATADLLNYSGSARPSNLLTDGPTVSLTWAPNGDGATNNGWRLNYAVVPAFTGYTPTIGKTISHTDVTITGVDLTPQTKVRVGVDILGVTYVNPTTVRVRVPGRPFGQTTIEISNDGVFWTNTKNPWNWFDQKCSEVTSCRDCNAVHVCNWCEDITTPSNSRCVDGAVACPAGAPASDACALAPNFRVTVREGDSTAIRVITQRFLPEVKDGRVKILVLPNRGSIPGVTAAGNSIQAREGSIPYTAPFLGTATNQTATFTYELTTLDASESGTVTITITPLNPGRVSTRAEVENAYKVPAPGQCQYVTFQRPTFPVGFRSFDCECPKGFRNSNTDTKLRSLCVDINECLPKSPCIAPATCNNTFGSFSCPCPKGYVPGGTARPTVRCDALPCPLTPWVVVKNQTMALPRELSAWNAQTPKWNSELVPAGHCSKCTDGVYYRTRQIDMAKWNDSPLCAAAPLNQSLPCSYPCKFTGTQGRLKYFYDELIRTKFDEIVMATYMKLDVKVAPIDSGANWASFRMENCNNSTLRAVKDVLLIPLLQDLFGTGSYTPLVEPASVRFPGSKCNLMNVYFYEQCGDGKTAFGEQCDDGNTVNGDGCSSSCTVESGWSCMAITAADPISQHRCCRTLVPLDQTFFTGQVTCGMNGMWRSNTATAGKDAALAVEALAIEEDFWVCGDLTIGSGSGDSKLVITGATLHVAGTLTINDDASLVLDNGGRIIVTDHCAYGAKEDTQQFVLKPDSGFTISNTNFGEMPAKDDTEASEWPVFVTVQRCAWVHGHLELTGVAEISRGSSSYYLIQSQSSCVTGRVSEDEEENAEHFETYESHGELPGGCSNFETDPSPEGDGVDLVLNHKDLCVGQIVGISMGVASVAILALVGLAMFGGAATTGGSGADYVAL